MVDVQIIYKVKLRLKLCENSITISLAIRLKRTKKEVIFYPLLQKKRNDCIVRVINLI